MPISTCWDRKSPAKSQRKVVRKEHLHYWRSQHNWVVYLKILMRENIFYVNLENWEQNTPSYSPRKLCEDHGYSDEWVSGQKPRLTKEGKTVKCKTNNFVPLVILSLSTNPGSNSSSTSISQDLSSTSPAQEPSDGLAPGDCCGSPPKKPKPNWRSSTSSRKVRRLDNGWSQSPQWGRWITEQSNVRCRCSRSCHSVDTILSVQNPDFTGYWKEFTKVSRAVAKTQKLFVRTIHWNLENFVKIYRGITALQHLVDPRQMALLKEPFEEWKKVLQQYCYN